jgi:hypothetical protein
MVMHDPSLFGDQRQDRDIRRVSPVDISAAAGRRVKLPRLSGMMWSNE